MSPGELRDQIRRPQFRLSDTPAPRSGEATASTPPPNLPGSTRTLLSSVLAYLKGPVLIRRRQRPPAAAGHDPATPATPAAPSPRGETARPARQKQQTRAPDASSVHSNLGP